LPKRVRITAAIRQHWALKILALDARCHLVKMIAGCALHAPHNLALLRRFAVNTLNRESTFKRSKTEARRHG